MLIAAGGAVAWSLLGLPLPLLLGPMAGCLVAGIAGARMRDVGLVGVVFRGVLGVAIGASITPELLGRLPSMAVTVSLIPVVVVAMGLIGYPFFRRIAGFDHATAFYASMPGGLQDMLVFGEEAGADVRALSLIHATRVLVIVSVTPFLIGWIWGIDLQRPPGAAAASLPWHEMALMVAALFAGWKGAERIGLFGASILGPMFATAALSLAGLVTHRPPVEAIWAAQFVIGLSVGARYAGMTLRELRVDVGASLGYCVALAAVTLTAVEALGAMALAPPLDLFLAFAPGGQAEMIILALIAGADMAFVVTHHLVRVLLVIMLAPLAARLLDRR